MALLKFNKGAIANLSTQAVSEGNVYITTDSQEMYVDVSGNKRIKISDFVTVATASELDTVALFDNAFYYVADTKTIVRYGGAGTDGKRIWEGINNTDEIEGLSDRVDDAETAIATLNTANTNTNKRIDELDAADIATTDGITVTTAVGNYAVGSTINPNTSLQDLVLNMLCQDSAPTITDSSLSISGTAKYLEIGTSGSISVTAKYNDGWYQYGYATLADGNPDTTQEGEDGKEKAINTYNDTELVDAKNNIYDGTTGANLTYLDINYNGSVVKSQTSGNTITATVESGTKTTSTTMSIGTKCSHNAGYIPVSILKNKYKNLAIASNANKTKSMTGFYWYIPMYHGFKYGTDLIADPKNITAAQVKGLSAITGSTAYNKTKQSKETADGSWKQYFIAVPTSYNWELKSIIDSNNLPLTVEKANEVELTFGTDTKVKYEVFYVNLDAAYDTKVINLTW